MQNDSVIIVYIRNHMDNAKIRLDAGFYNQTKTYLYILFFVKANLRQHQLFHMYLGNDSIAGINIKVIAAYNITVPNPQFMGASQGYKERLVSYCC